MSDLYRGSEASLAAVLGGAVTRERLLRSARIEGRGGSPLVRSLLAQSLPAVHDLAMAYGTAGTTLRLDSTFLSVSPKATRLLPADLLRKERCVPVEILDDLCILAVTAGRAASAAAAVREALQRDVLPVVANGEEIDAILGRLDPPPSAVPLGAIPRRDSPVHTRFRELVLEDALVDAVTLPPAAQAAPQAQDRVRQDSDKPKPAEAKGADAAADGKKGSGSNDGDQKFDPVRRGKEPVRRGKGTNADEKARTDRAGGGVRPDGGAAEGASEEEAR